MWQIALHWRSVWPNDPQMKRWPTSLPCLKCTRKCLVALHVGRVSGQCCCVILFLLLKRQVSQDQKRLFGNTAPLLGMAHSFPNPQDGIAYPCCSWLWHNLTFGSGVHSLKWITGCSDVPFIWEHVHSISISMAALKDVHCSTLGMELWSEEAKQDGLPSHAHVCLQNKVDLTSWFGNLLYGQMLCGMWNG